MRAHFVEAAFWTWVVIDSNNVDILLEADVPFHVVYNVFVHVLHASWRGAF